MALASQCLFKGIMKAVIFVRAFILLKTYIWTYKDKTEDTDTGGGGATAKKHTNNHIL